jgi:hypothetical protein
VGVRVPPSASTIYTSPRFGGGFVFLAEQPPSNQIGAQSYEASETEPEIGARVVAGRVWWCWRCPVMSRPADLRTEARCATFERSLGVH